MDNPCVVPPIPAQYLCRGLMLYIVGHALQWRQSHRHNHTHRFLSAWSVYTAVLDTLHTERNLEHCLRKKKKAMSTGKKTSMSRLVSALKIRKSLYAHAQSRTYRSPAISPQSTLPWLPMPGFAMATLFFSSAVNYLQKTPFFY